MQLPRFSWRRNAVLALAMMSSLSVSAALSSESAYAEDMNQVKSTGGAVSVQTMTADGLQSGVSTSTDLMPGESFSASNELFDVENGQEPGVPGGQQPGDEGGQQPGEEPGVPGGQQPGDEGGQQPGEEPGVPGGQQPGDEGGQQPGDEGEHSTDSETGDSDDGLDSDVQDGWVELDGKKYWYVDGAPVTNNIVVDPETGAKYWASEDGSIVVGEDVYVPRDPSSVDHEEWASSDAYRNENGMWIRLGSDGEMVLGEDNHNGHWYYFDPNTGEMMKGFIFQSGKWVYYDDIMGWMVYGEQYRPANDTDTQLHWYYFDEWTGATTYKWRYIQQGSSGKWVYYDDYMGWMVYGEQYRPANNSDTQLHWYYFDEWTGATTYRWKYVASQNKTVYYDDYMGWMIYGWRDTGDHQYGVGTNWHFFDRYTGALMTGNDRNNSAFDCYNNIRGGSSKTPYYIVVDKNNFRTVIFQWSGSDWDVAKVFRCGLGRPEANNGRGTQEGFWYLGENVPSRPVPSYMWRANYDRMFNDTTSGVKYRVHYIWDQGFHSTVYTSSTPPEQQLERYISDGCVRLLEEDAAWLYNNCANGTRVYIFSRY